MNKLPVVRQIVQDKQQVVLSMSVIYRPSGRLCQ